MRPGSSTLNVLIMKFSGAGDVFSFTMKIVRNFQEKKI
jgi:hypothetical protein